MFDLSFVYPQYLWLLLLLPLTAALALYGRRAMNRLRLWGGLALRLLILLLLIFALAGIQVRLPSRTLTVVFVLDASDSILPGEQSTGEAMIRQAIQAMPAGDRAAVVVFGEDALVERLSSPDSDLNRITSVPVTTRTDIGSALQLAVALFPNEGAKRVVLLSDGRENLNNALKQAELAAFQDIELQYIPLGESGRQVEVRLDALEAPADVREGQQFDLNVTIESSAPTGATLRIFSDGELFYTQNVNLQEGANRYTIPVTNPAPGFHRYRAQVTPDADFRLQNNEASAFTVVHGPPSILLVEGSPGDGENLRDALEAAQMHVTVTPPNGLPSTLPELNRYDAVILANVPAMALPAGAMEALPVYVRDLGKGLLMTGGDSAFGAGGYLRTPLEAALPVYMDVRSRELASNLALVMAVDKSGSMGRCHCDDPDLNQSYTAVETGQPKVDIAKEAIMRSAAALGEQDYLGVVTFDSQAHWALRISTLVDPHTLENAISGFRAEGQTNMLSGVNAAYEALQSVNARRKHIILMTDGWVHSGDLTVLVEKMREEGITLSIIAAGEGSAEYLQLLSETGGGRFYPARDMMSVPDVFLKETVQSVGQYIIEEPFFPLPANPSPALRAIDERSLPGLFGYNGTSPKGSARMDLLTPRGDPLLATWQFGLGRSAAWTSDVTGRWASEWVTWEEFPRFSSQLVSWLLPSPQVEGLAARVSVTEQGALIQLDAQDAEGRPLNNLEATARLISPNLETTEVRLQQVGPGQYQAEPRAGQPGAYLVWMGVNHQSQPMGQMTLGLVVPYSPEYRAEGANIGFLDELARITGGGPLGDPVQAFLHNLPAASSALEIWRALLMIAALLFPIDVALRRLIITRRDLQTARAWVGSRLPGARPVAGEREAPILGNLFNARDRARQRTRNEQDQPPGPSSAPGRPTDTPRPTSPPPTSSAPPPTPSAPPPTSAPPPAPPPAEPKPGPADESSLARLREAKKRARRK